EAGGAERVCSLLVGAWAEKGHQVTLVTLAPREADFYPVPPAVQRIALNAQQPSTSIFGAVRGNWRRVRALRRTMAMQDPDVMVSFVETMNILALLASLGLRKPVVISERTDMS